MSSHQCSSKTDLSQSSLYDDPSNPLLTKSIMKLDLKKTALVVIDPQIDFLSEKGVSWAVFGASITENGTVDNIVQLLKLQKTMD